MKTGFVLMVVSCLLPVLALATTTQPKQDISRYIITTAILNSSASLTCNVKLRNFVTWKKNGDKHLSYSLQSAYCQPNTDETIPKGYKVTCIGKQTILTIEMINFNHNGTWTCEDNSEELSAYLLLVENKTKDSMTHIPTSRTLTTEMEAQTTATQSTIPSSTDSMTHTPSSRKPTTEMKVQTKATQTRSSLNDVTTNSPGRKYNNAKDMSVDLTPIIAGAVGGAVVFLCVVAALLCWRIRRRSRLLKETNEPTSHYEIPEVLQDSESRKTHLFRCMSKRLGTRPSIDRQIDAVKGNNVDMIEDVPERTASDSSKSIINNDYQNLTGTGNTSNPYETLVDKDDEGRRYERLATYQNALQIEH